MKDPTQPGAILTKVEKDVATCPDSNRIDPNVVCPECHDLYPKPGLDGTFLGNGFLVRPRWVFSVEARLFGICGLFGRCCGLIRCGLEQSSALYLLLCRGEGARCESPVSVTLSVDFACREEESVRKLGAVYRCQPPPSVHFHCNVAALRQSRNAARKSVSVFTAVGTRHAPTCTCQNDTGAYSCTCPSGYESVQEDKPAIISQTYGISGVTSSGTVENRSRRGHRPEDFHS